MFVEENPAPVTRQRKYDVSEDDVKAIAEQLHKRAASGDYIKDTTEYGSASSAHNARDRYRKLLVHYGFMADTEEARKGYSASVREETTGEGKDEKTVYRLFLKVAEGVITLPDAKAKASK